MRTLRIGGVCIAPTTTATEPDRYPCKKRPKPDPNTAIASDYDFLRTHRENKGVPVNQARGNEYLQNLEIYAQILNTQDSHIVTLENSGEPVEVVPVGVTA